MKKRFLILFCAMLTALSLAACSSEGGSGSSSTGGSDSGITDTGSDSGNDSGNDSGSDSGNDSGSDSGNDSGSDSGDDEKPETHDYVLQNEVEGTCSTAGTVAHYTCNHCDKLFDLAKNEITSVAGELDPTNHSGEIALAATTQPSKLTYTIGEAFDPTGMTVVFKCSDCDGEAIDPQFLVYEYQTDAGVFANGDTKVTVRFNDYTFDVAITTSKLQAQLSDVEASYETVCGKAPVINVTSNVPELPITVTYFEGETEVQAEDFVAGKSYVAKISVEGTDTVEGVEATAVVTVSHGYSWVDDKSDWKKLNYVCACGDMKDFYAMNYQSPYVDSENLGIDLSKFVFNADNVSVKSVKQIVRMLDGTYVSAAEGNAVDIEFINDGMVYSFAADKYEKPSAEWKPYILTLAVVYDINGIECPVVVEAKLVDKLIKNAEDLLSVQYKDGATIDAGGKADTKYYVLANDINAEGITLEAQLAWQDGIGFRGVFEGNGHTISNLNTPAWGYGLFGAIGQNAKIQNVKFTNVTCGDGGTLFALVLRTASFENVSVEFNVNSPSCLLADTANGSTFGNVMVKTCKDSVVLKNVNDAAMEALPAGITMQYYPTYTVTFDTDGGNAIDAATVTEGKKVPAPTPEKYTDEFDYEFLGWYYGETAWDFDTPITGDITLVAKWKEVEKTNVLLDASKGSISKWDYGSTFTTTTEADAYYGNVFKFTLEGSGCEQGVQHTAIKTTGYEKVYFYVYNPLAKEVRLNVHTPNTWGKATLDLAAGWTKVELDAATFNDGAVGQINFIIQEKNAESLAGEWKISSFYGLKTGETAPDVQKSNVLLDASKATLSKWDYGTDFTVGKATDAEYGDVWTLTFADNGYEKSITHTAIDTTGYEKVSFHVYNPLGKTARLTVHGGYGAWGAATVELGAGWTKVELDVSVFNADVVGQIFMVIQEIDAGSLAGEWKISSFYGA